MRRLYWLFAAVLLLAGCGRLLPETRAVEATRTVEIAQAGPTDTHTPTSTPTATPTTAPTITPTLTPDPTAAVQTTQTALAPPKLGDTRVREKDGAVVVGVPAGEFPMGSTDEDIDAAIATCLGCRREWFTVEQPQHAVYLDAFWIDRTEVTNAQYRQCVEDGACSPPEDHSSRTRDSYYDNPDFGDYPVVNATWFQAQEYAEWVGGRLPTEAEWEYAARGPSGNIYPWGNNAPNDSLLNYETNVGDTTKVGSYPDGASWCGALDMASNVWEWVADWYGDYPSGQHVNPTGPTSGDARVLRGGAFFNSARGVRCAVRNWYYPDLRLGVGFRVVVPPD